MIKVVELRNYVEILSGFAFDSNLFSDSQDGIPLIRIRDVGKNFSKTFFAGQYDEKYIVKNGDYLIGMDGDFRLSEWKGVDALLNQRVCKISVIKLNELSEKYLLHFFLNELKLIEDTTSFATVKHLSVEKVKKIQIPLPPLPQQQKIANILDAADALRQNDKALIAKYDELTQALFLDMFGDPVSNPKGWEKVKFSEVGKLDRGKSKHRPRNAPELLGGKYPLIQTGDIANSGGYITNYKSTYSEIGLLQSKLWKSGTLCITIAANIAKTGILTFDACFPDSVVGFIPNELTNNEYTQYWMSFLQKIIEDAAPESAQKNINLAILKDLDFPLPPIDLQNQFAKRVAVIEEQKAIAQKSLEQSESLFNSLLQKAFKGELV
jgi:type I restriction enzyme S subunit